MITVSSRRLSAQEQFEWIDQVRSALRAAPLVRPTMRDGTPFRVRTSGAGELGWVADGTYRYSPTQKNGKPWPPIPSDWTRVANEVAGEQPWDSAIINWYDEDASLGWHDDINERDLTKPIVTVSLGDACAWAVREDSSSPIHETRLESGDITALEGPTRSWLHAVKKIVADPLFSPLKTRGRISITLRVAG